MISFFPSPHHSVLFLVLSSAIIRLPSILSTDRPMSNTSNMSGMSATSAGTSVESSPPRLGKDASSSGHASNAKDAEPFVLTEDLVRVGILKKAVSKQPLAYGRKGASVQHHHPNNGKYWKTKYVELRSGSLRYFDHAAIAFSSTGGALGRASLAERPSLMDEEGELDEACLSDGRPVSGLDSGPGSVGSAYSRDTTSSTGYYSNQPGSPVPQHHAYSRADSVGSIATTTATPTRQQWGPKASYSSSRREILLKVSGALKRSCSSPACFTAVYPPHLPRQKARTVDRKWELLYQWIYLSSPVRFRSVLFSSLLFPSPSSLFFLFLVNPSLTLPLLLIFLNHHAPQTSCATSMHASDSQTVLSGGTRAADPLSVSCRVSVEDDEGCTFELLGPAGVSRLWRAETAQECSAWVRAIKRWSYQSVEPVDCCMTGPPPTTHHSPPQSS